MLSFIFLANHINFNNLITSTSNSQSFYSCLLLNWAFDPLLTYPSVYLTHVYIYFYIYPVIHLFGKKTRSIQRHLLLCVSEQKRSLSIQFITSTKDQLDLSSADIPRSKEKRKKHRERNNVYESTLPLSFFSKLSL